MRIDKFLKVSRLIKRRTVAHDAATEERIFLNGKAAKPGARVNTGDIIEIFFGNSHIKVRVLGIADHISKDDANSLYEIIND